MYKCNNCGCRFEEPITVEERHGLDTPPYEKVDVCPRCRVAGMFEESEDEE